jgi:hypothetical protein
MLQTELQELNKVQKTNEYINKEYDSIKEKYSKQYIAIKDGRLIAHNENLDAIFKQLKSKRINPATVFIEFLHPKDMVLIL